MPGVLSTLLSVDVSKGVRIAVLAGGVGLSALLFCWKTPSRAVCTADEKYEKKSADEKMKLLYTRCRGWEGDAREYPEKNEFAHFLLDESYGPTFAYYSDELYTGQRKSIHPVGCVASGVFESFNNHPYSGVFTSEANPIIIRLSHAGQPKGNISIPGMAVKFLRDGLPSVNVFALNSFEGIEGGNFFSVDLSNHLPHPKAVANKIASLKFGAFSPHSTMVGISEFAEATQDGTPVEGEPNFPFQLRFVPNPNLATAPQFVNAAHDTPLGELMETIPMGTVLYTVLAIEYPEAPAKPIGAIRTTSPLIHSKYGDEKLFFRHQRMNDDLERRPEWRDHVTKSGY
eukprot:TRINITY_DN6886_c3_g1_i1.p1 TRINITY_DN6886_c3_g1~~TRINITY_DN6886_c3_g1_i1.p1  ORF type:complete len:358 (+),score=58.03 TRINITY_DN6886_c3_g1_i1:47-1075(+)